MKTFKNIMLGVLIAFVGLTFLVFLIPTDTTEPEVQEEVTVAKTEPAPPQRDRVLFDSFMEGCNDTGKNEEFCTCTYDYFVETYGLEAMLQSGLEVLDDESYVSPEMLDAVVNCIDYYTE
jgi:hypothetical protein